MVLTVMEGSTSHSPRSESGETLVGSCLYLHGSRFLYFLWVYYMIISVSCRYVYVRVCVCVCGGRSMLERPGLKIVIKLRESTCVSIGTVGEKESWGVRYLHTHRHYTMMLFKSN